MTSTVPVEWRVPVPVWRGFENYVFEKYGDIDGYKSREVDLAIREYLDEDDGVAVEERVNRLLKKFADERDPHTQKNNSYARSGRDAETTKVRVRIDENLKARFADLASKGDARVGECFTKALISRAEGGRMRRIEEKLNKLESLDRLENVATLLESIDESNGSSEDVVELLERINGDVPTFLELLDTDTGKLGSVERDTIAICNRLPDPPGQFVRDDLDEAIRAEGKTSDPTIEKYRERVLEKLDYAPHPENDELFMPRERTEQLRESNPDAPRLDAPAIDRKDPGDLSRDEKVQGARIKLAREASTRPKKKAGWSPGELKRHAFRNLISDSSARDITKAAAEAPGFAFKRIGSGRNPGPKKLTVSLAEVSQEILDETELGDADRSATDSEPLPTIAITDGEMGDS